VSSYTSISSEKLSRLIGTANAPALIDVRIDQDFAADPTFTPGARRRSYLDVQEWASQMTGQAVVAICQKGEKLSEGTAAWLRSSNIAAEILENGPQGWKNAKFPTVPAEKILERDRRGCAGFWGSLISTVGIFLPSFLLVLIAAPLLARHRGNANVQGFVKGAYAAAIGTIVGACILLGRIAIGDWLTAPVGMVSLAVLFRWKISNPVLIAATAAIGLIAYPLLQPGWVMVK
jgi:rhodanese-related sulfurtransferase